MDIDELLRYTVERGASDLHLKAGNVPFVRVDGELSPAELGYLSAADTDRFADALMSEHKKREFEQTNEADLGYTLSGVGRFRVNVFRQRGVIGLAIRRVRAEVPSFEELRLPPVMSTLAASPRGLILITGPTGTGKTTTIAAMIGHINRTRRTHIVTVEDPIEVVHDDQLSIVQQREIGIDTESYAAALRHVIRQDPDVIFIGEIRDADSALAAIQAAETGHLVLSTLHTVDATETVNRVIDFFPPYQQKQVRLALAGTLRGIICQRLVTTVDGDRTPTLEILVNNGRIAERIVDPERTSEIEEVVADGAFYGMMTFDQSLLVLLQEGKISTEAAFEAVSSRHDFELAMQQAGLSLPV